MLDTAEERLDGPQFELCRHSGAAEAFLRDAAIGEEALSHRHTTQVQALQRPRPGPLPQDQFGAAAADIHHESQPIRRWQTVRHAVIDETGFLEARHDLDRVAQRRLGLVHEAGVLVRPANGARTCGTNPVRMDVAQTLTKTRQAVERTNAGIRGDDALVREALGQAHGFANAIENRELPVAQLADDHVKAVGAEVDSRDDLGLGVLRR